MDISLKEMWIAIACVAIYVLMIVYGAFFSKKSQLQNDSMEEFVAAGRKLNFIIVLCSLIGVYYVAAMFVGWFSWGMKEGLIAHYVYIYPITAFFVTYYFAHKVWVWGKQFGSLTMPDFVKTRYKSKPLTVITSIVSIIIEMPWTVIELAAIGWLVNAVSGGRIPNEIGIVFFGLFMLMYVLYGGMKSIAMTELIQGILVTIVVIFCCYFAVNKLFGGFAEMYAAIAQVAPENLTFNYGGHYAYTYWDSIIITGTIGIMGWLSCFARIYPAKSVKEVKKTAAAGGVICAMFGVTLGALEIGGILNEGALNAGNLGFFYLLNQAMGPVFLGIAGVVVLAAGMSMISVIVAGEGVVVSENIVRELKNDVSEITRRRSCRICIVGITMICMILAMMELPNLAQIAIVTYEGLAQIVPLIFFGLFWKRANKWSVGISFAVSILIAVVFTVWPVSVLGGWTPGCFALGVNLLLNIVLGLATKQEPFVDELFKIANSYQEDSQGRQIMIDDQDGVDSDKTMEQSA